MAASEVFFIVAMFAVFPATPAVLAVLVVVLAASVAPPLAGLADASATTFRRVTGSGCTESYSGHAP